MKSEYINIDDIEAFRDRLTVVEWLPLWVMLETGLRVGDVVALRVCDVKADGIHYTAQKTGKKGVAKISKKLRDALPMRGRWLFPGRNGRHLTRQAVWYRVKKAAERAGQSANGKSPHSFRKTFAVELYRERGFRAVQNALQHDSAATTEIYSFADWNTGENACLPLLRKDMQLLVKMVLEALGKAP